jgi:hypothetical protein
LLGECEQRQRHGLVDAVRDLGTIQPCDEDAAVIVALSFEQRSIGGQR